MNNRRTGKIARLPKQQRDTVNLLIQDGVSYPNIIAALAETGFKGITEQNLVAWKQGGHEDWLKEQQRLDDLKARKEFALEYVKASEGGKIHEAGLNLAASQIYEVLDTFDVEKLKELLKGDPANYADIVNALAKLSKSTLDIDKFKENVAEQKRKIEKEIGKAKTDGGLTPETLAKIEEALKLL